MQQGDFSSYYHHQYPPNPNPNPIPNPNPNPNPNPATDFHSRAYASAPPFNTSCATSDFTDYSQNYPPYSQNPDHAPPTAPSYTPTQPTSTASPPNPNLISSFSPALPPQQPSQFPPYESHVPYHPQPPVTTAQQPQQPLPSYYPPFDQHQTATNYAPPPTNPSPNSPYSSAAYSAPFSRVGGSSSLPPQYDSPYESNPNSMKYDSGVVGGGYFDDKYGGYSRSRSDSGSDLYGKQPESNSFSRYDTGRDDAYGDGVFAYQGGKVEPYGARGTIPKSSASTLFDDYGRPINMSSGKDSHSSSGVSGSGSSKIVRAIPKVEVQQDAKSGVQKFRVKLLAESGGQSTMDVLCQIGLDGIRMLDPNTSRTLRIYPLENITRCELADSSTLAFWSKSSVDIEPRRIRLQSNSYTASTLLDIVTAATVQVKEMGGSTRPSESLKTAEQQLAEKKKGLTDWMTFIKPGNEEKDHWVPDEAVTKCTACGTDFGAFVRKHHCRNCGDIFCDKCTHGRIALTADENAQPVRVCDRCLAEVTQRLSNAKEAANKPAFQSHEDLARKLQDEMEKNRKSSSGSKSDVSGKRMREVACPICTVHLQVQVPSSGSETIECGVCQHPFLVSAH